MTPAVYAIIAPGIGRGDGTTFLERAQIPQRTPCAVIQLGLSQVITTVITMCFHVNSTCCPRNITPGIGRGYGTTFLERAQIPYHTPRAVIQLGLSQVITGVITMCFHQTPGGEPRVGSSAADMWLLPIQSDSQSCFLSVETMFCFAVIYIGLEINIPLLRLGPYHLFLKDGSDSMHLRECYNG